MTDGYSFIIPAYNDALGLRRHFEYFAKRTERIQLIVVDDCSEDDTESEIDSTSFPSNIDLLYHRMEKNSGPGPARNYGLNLAQENWVMFLDADDILAPNFFDILRVAPLGEAVDFVLFPYHLSHSSQDRYTYEMHPPDRKFFSANSCEVYPTYQFELGALPEAAGTVNFPWNKLYRLSFLKEKDIKFPNLRMHEDITLHWQSFLRCRMFSVLFWAPPIITHYEIKDGNRATQYIGEERLPIFKELVSVHDEVLSHASAEIVSPIFSEFCSGLFNWMTGALCDDGSEHAQRWRLRYREAAQQFCSDRGLTLEVNSAL